MEVAVPEIQKTKELNEDEISIASVRYNVDAGHEEIKKEIASQLSALGFKVTMETPIQNYIIDVLARKNGKTYAFEVGQNNPFKLPDLSLFIEGVYHAPKGRQRPIKFTMDLMMQTLDEEVKQSLKRLFSIIPNLQKFTGKPQKFVIEIHPDGKYDWGFHNE